MDLKSTDCWAVLSPGRTGSKVIVDCIRNSYVHQNIDLIAFTPDSTAEINRGATLIHSHQCDIYQQLREANYSIVVSTRDMVDSTISWCIQKHLGAWHLYSKDDYFNIKIEPFVLNMETFYEYYDVAIVFYRSMTKSLLQYNSKVKIIDYNEFENDHTVIYELLDLPMPSFEMSVPLKNPGSPESWIKNWHDIQTELYRLKRMPEILA